MKSNGKISRRERILRIALVLFCFCLYTYTAVVLPIDEAPDEWNRYGQLARYIYEHNALPVGDEPEIVMAPSGFAYMLESGLQERDMEFGSWGYSYAHTPYLPTMLTYPLMKLASLFSTSEAVLLVAARMVSVLSICGCLCLCFAIAPYVFERRISTYLFAVFVGLLPQVIYLAGYHNNDSFSLFTCMLMLYFWVSGRASCWKASKCVGLGIAMSLCLLTYYYAYGYILMSVVFCVISCLRDDRIAAKGRLILQRGCLIAGVVAICAGWYFVRNAILYDGDILGFGAREACREQYSHIYTIHYGNPGFNSAGSVFEMLIEIVPGPCLKCS